MARSKPWAANRPQTSITRAGQGGASRERSCSRTSYCARGGRKDQQKKHHSSNRQQRQPPN